MKRAIESRYVNIIGHPTGRLIGGREGLPLDFPPLFKLAANNGTAMEINAGYPRLDLNDDANPEAGEWDGPDHYKRAYRHVVDRVRARGASNIKWVFHTNNYSYPLDTWNFASAYYPGADYVDWLGLSVYGQQFKTVRQC